MGEAEGGVLSALEKTACGQTCTCVSYMFSLLEGSMIPPVIQRKAGKEVLKIHIVTNKSEGWIKKWGKDLNRHFPKEDVQMSNQHMKIRS